MRLVPLAAVAALTSAVLGSETVAQPSYEPPPLPAGCTGSANEPCALLDYTQRTLAPALAGATLAPVQGQPTLFSGTSTDPALPLFDLAWAEVKPSTAEQTASEFMNGLKQPDQLCAYRPYGQPTAIGQSFDLRCNGGQGRALQAFLHVVPGQQRTIMLVLVASLDRGPALLARGERAAVALAQAATPTHTAPPTARLQRPYSRPANYDQLRADCADDSDIAKQIAGCDAVLANPGEQNSYPIAHNNRGHARERSGDMAAALADYEQAIKLDPTYAMAHINRAGVLARLGRTDEAIASLDTAIKIENSGWARYERGRLLAAKGDHVRALADLEEAVRLAPGEAEIRTERDRVRALEVAQAPPAAPVPTPARNSLEAAVLGSGRPYVGEALLRAPLGPLPAGDALSTYTRDLLAPGFPGLTLSPLSASSPLAFRGGASGLPDLTLVWQDVQGADAARARMSQFERELNGSCNDNRVLAQRSGEDARVAIHATTCPTVAPPYQLLWLSASDRERTRLLLVAGPLAQGEAIQAASDRIIAALGMARTPVAVASGPAAPQPAPAPPSTHDTPLADQPAPPATSLAEAALRAFLYLGNMDAEIHARIERPAPNHVRLGTDSTGATGGAGLQEAEVRSCNDVVVTEWSYEGGARKLEERYVVNFDRLRSLLRRDGEEIVTSDGPYGERIFVSEGKEFKTGVLEEARRLRPNDTRYNRADTILHAIAQFCPGPQGAAQQRAASPVPSTAKPREVRTARGLTADKPYSLVYPADLVQGPAGSYYDLELLDEERDFVLTLRIRLAPNITAESAAQEFAANLSQYETEMRKQYPSFKLHSHTLLRLPAGQAQFFHWSYPLNDPTRGSHFVAIRLFEKGIGYSLTFHVSEAVFEERRDAISFILANFATSDTVRPCCVEPIPLP